MPVTYNSINVQLPAIDQDNTTEWITKVATTYGKRIGNINYIFVDDEEILRINRKYIQHDYYTDHIGFDYTQGRILAGDTYISLDTIRTNATLYGKTYEDELNRVIIHSVLHLCGIDDKTPLERQTMQQAEDKAMAIITPTKSHIYK